MSGQGVCLHATCVLSRLIHEKQIFHCTCLILDVRRCCVCLVSCKRLWQQSVCCFIELWCEQAGCLCNVQHGQLRMTTCLSQWKLNGRKPQQIIPKSRVGNVERMESCKNVKSCGDVAERWVGGLISLYYIQKRGLMMKRVLLCSRSTSMPTLRPSFWTLFQPSELCWTAASPISSSTG